MSLETLIAATLGPLVAGRIYPDAAPLATPRPYITYQQVGGTPVTYTSKELPDHEHALVQINIWSDTRLQASLVRKLAEVALVSAAGFEARADSGPVSQHEPDMTPPGYGVRQDFSIWLPR